MAQTQTESLSVVTLDPVSKKIEGRDNQQGKKFKQARLPFMPIDHDQKTTTTPPGSKKRKLSDSDTPSPKQAKVSAKPMKPLSPNGDAEVSSSSEAEPGPITGHQKGGKKVSTLDRFLYKKREEHQDEISSTNDCVPMAIDLTDESDVDSANTKCDKSSAIETEKEDKIDRSSDPSAPAYQDSGSQVSEVNVEEKTGQENCAPNVSDIQSTIEKTDQDITVSSNDTENKENIEEEILSLADDEIDQSFVSDTSVCEAALKTPAKDKPLESVLKTPVVAVEKDGSDQSAESLGPSSDITPKSEKKKCRALSESKKKEKETLRLQREQEREEKRLQKEREKEEKEKERLEKKKQKEEEKAEKERQRQEEKDKKEKEKLEKQQQREEEKKKKEEAMQAKLEEKRKKEEERKQKEEEKKLKEEEKQKQEEEKLKKKEKEAQSFKSFFIEKTPTVSPPKVKEGKNQYFMPFEMKPNMRLAPAVRVDSFSPEAKTELEQYLLKQECEDLYLGQLKSGSIKKRKYEKTYPRELSEEKDIEIMCHDEETIKKTLHKVKFLKFAENTRPPYYGTWTKPSTTLSAKNPFKQDEALFDYEVDSDDEWEEEDPGESVSSDEEDEDKDKDEEEEDADGWMVPHGYLSDDEGIDNEDDMDMSKKKQLQAARQEAWEREIKMQTQALRMISLGCVWEGETTTIAAKQLEKLLSFKAVCLNTEPIPTSFVRSEGDSSLSNSEKTDKLATPRLGLKKTVPEEAIPDLIRLVHGNPTGVKNLLREFRMYWKLKTTGDLDNHMRSKQSNESATDTANSQGDSDETKGDMPNDISMEVDENVDAPATSPGDKTEANRASQLQFAISKRQLEKKITEIAGREKRPDVKCTCWYVKDEILKQFGQEDIKLPNSWEYVLIKAPTWALSSKGTPKPDDTGVATSGRATPTIPSIKQFAQAMSPAQIQAQQALGSPAAPKTSLKSVEQETTETKTEIQMEEKPALAKDQSSIKTFFKVGANSPKPLAVEVNGTSQKDSNIPDSKTEALAADEKGKEVLESYGKTSGTIASEAKPSREKPQNDIIKIKPVKRNCLVLVERLDQPAEKLLKVTPASASDKMVPEAVDGETVQAENKPPSVESMDTDVIVLD